jgi:hypothetical protein
MYLRLLEEAVRRPRGETVTRPPVQCDLSVAASIPVEYIVDRAEDDLYAASPASAARGGPTILPDVPHRRYGDPPGA